MSLSDVGTRLGVAEEVLSKLKDSKSKWHDRLGACEVLSELFPHRLQEHSDELLKMLKDSTWQAREGACEALGKLPPDDLAEDACELLKMMEDNNQQVRQAACKALWQLFLINWPGIPRSL